MKLNLQQFNQEFSEKTKQFSALIKNFKDLEDRFDKVLAQKKRKFEIRDTALEQDFGLFAFSIQKFTFEIYDSVQQLRFNCLKIFPSEETLTLKELGIACLFFNTQIRKFDAIFKILDPQVPAAKLSLKWGIIEIAHNDLLNLEKQLLSLVKEVKKYYE